jgi:hypothetical protein
MLSTKLRLYSNSLRSIALIDSSPEQWHLYTVKTVGTIGPLASTTHVRHDRVVHKLPWWNGTWVSLQSKSRNGRTILLSVHCPHRSRHLIVKALSWTPVNVSQCEEPIGLIAMPRSIVSHAATVATTVVSVVMCAHRHSDFFLYATSKEKRNYVFGA